MDVKIGKHDKRWDVAAERFDRNFDLLWIFKEREGHARVPMGCHESGTHHLGAWPWNQLHLNRHGVLEVLDRQK